MAFRPRLNVWYMNPSAKHQLRTAFGSAFKEYEPLSKYTSARIGGPAELFAIAESADQLAELTRSARQMGLKPLILGGGSNILVSDVGVSGVVILNRARTVEFREQGDGRWIVHVESGANLGALARQCVARDLSGLEWAATVPGTVGGAVFGNAGAHGSDLAGNLISADLLQPDGSVRSWAKAELGLGYRTSLLKKNKGGQIVLAADLALMHNASAASQARVDEFVAHRKRTQPPGASMGSMFKNPPGDHAGRLIEAAGMKGKRIGQIEISAVHANFFVNLGEGRAADVFALIHLAHEAVKDKFGVDLELEVELVGEWSGQC